MASGKNFAGWVTGDLLKDAENRIARDYRGNVSKYVVDLIEDDIRGRPAAAAADDNILVALARRFHPTIAAEIAAILGQTNQARAIARVLEALLESGRRGVNPEGPLHIYSSKEEFLAIVRQQPAIFQALQAVAEEAGTYGVLPNSPPNSLIAAEEKRRAARAEAAEPRASRRKNSPKSDPGGS